MTQITSYPTNDKEYFNDIVKTIHQQIQYPNRMIFFSWGTHNFVGGATKQDKDYPSARPLLRFKVNGNKFKGYVHIIYNTSDYYDIEFISTRNVLKMRYEDIDAFSLQNVIDEYVEKISSYII